jgi:hypothetical protein
VQHERYQCRSRGHTNECDSDRHVDRDQYGDAFFYGYWNCDTHAHCNADILSDQNAYTHGDSIEYTNVVLYRDGDPHAHRDVLSDPNAHVDPNGFAFCHS